MQPRSRATVSGRCWSRCDHTPDQHVTSPMTDDWTRQVEAFFHGSRAARKRRPIPGEGRIRAALLQRARQIEWEEYAARSLWEGQW